MNDNQLLFIGLLLGIIFSGLFTIADEIIYYFRNKRRNKL